VTADDPVATKVRVLTGDGLTLEAEFAPAVGDPAGVAVVLCHPHPQYGGSMRSIVTSVLFAELPAAGYPCLRFNFRGVEASDGVHSHGELEPLDIAAAITALAERIPGTPIALVGWSFGADMALSVVDPRVAGWVAIAPPMRYSNAFASAIDPRPKFLVLAEHDEFRAPPEVEQEVSGWVATSIAIVPGASHFFIGRTDRVVTETRAGLAEIAARS
jgi:uncharacterized protein